jgi:fibronectin-binding autotransporter adhesin
MNRRLILLAALAVLPVAATAQTLYWDANFTGTGSGNIGGTWDTGTNWTTLSDGAVVLGDLSAWVDGSNVVFSAGTDGTGTWTVTVAGTVTTGSMLFEENGNKTISGGTIAFGPSGLVINTDALLDASGNTTAINSILAGTGGLTVWGNGDLSPTGGGSGTRLVLGGANTFTGDVTVKSGLLGFTNGWNFGDAANQILLDGGGIQYEGTSGLALDRDIRVTADANNTIRVYGSRNLYLTGHLGNETGVASASIQHTDSGSLWLSGTNNFTGEFFNRAGSLLFGNSNSWENTHFKQTDGQGNLYYELGGTLKIGELTTQRDVYIGSLGTLDIVSGNLTFDDQNFHIQGAGSNRGFLTSSSGALTVNAPFAYTTYGDQAIRVFVKDSDEFTPLEFVKNGIGSVTIDRVNTFTGGSTINAGRVRVENPRAFGTGDVTVAADGQVYIVGQAGGVVENNFSIAGDGPTETAGDLGALRFERYVPFSGNASLTADSRLTTYGANDIGVLRGDLTGAFNLEKTGPGTLILEGNGSGLTGTTTVSAGTLWLRNSASLGGPLAVTAGTALVGGAVGGDISVAAGQTIGAYGGSTIGSLTLGTAAAVQAHGNAVALTVGGNLTLNGTHNVNLVNKPAPGTGAIPLFTYGGTLTGDATNLALVEDAKYRAPAVSRFDTTTTTGSVLIDLGERKNLTWATVGGTWDTATTANFNDGLGASTFYWADRVTFGESGAGTVNISGIVQPSAVIIDNTSTYTINGAAGNGIAGGTGITKNGSGTAILGGVASTFTGPIAINGGILRIQNREAVGNTSGITVAAGAQFDFGGHAPGAGGSNRALDFTIAGTGPGGTGAITNSGAAVFAGAGIRNLTLADDATVSTGTGRWDIGRVEGLAHHGTILGNGFTLTKIGAPDMVVRTTANDISYVVAQGALIAEDSDLALGTTSVTVNSGATLGTYGAREMLVPLITMQAGSTLTNNGGAQGAWRGDFNLLGDITVNTGSQSIVLTGAIDAAPGAALTKINGNTLRIDGAANFTGPVNINAGTLQLGNGGTTPTLGTPSAINIGTAGGAATLTHRMSGDLSISSPINFLHLDSVLQQNGYNGMEKLTLTGAVGTDATKGFVTATRGEIVFAGGSTGLFDTLRIQGEPGGARGTVTVEGGASLTARIFDIGMQGNNSGTFRQTGGTVTIGTGGVRVGHWDNGRDDFGSEMNVSGGLFDASTTVVNVGWDGRGTMTVSGTGLVKAGTLRVDTNGADRPGIVNLQPGGRVEVGAGGTTNDGTAGSQLNLAGGTLASVASSTWASRMDANATTTSTVEIGAGLTTTQSGLLTGSGNVQKTGLGTWALTNTGSTHTGTIEVNQGILAGSGSTPSAINVAAGTTLSGTGSRSGDITLNDGGILSPGANPSVGVLGQLTLGAAGKTVTLDGIMNFDLNGDDSTSTADDFVTVNADNLVFGAANLITPRFFGSTISAGTYGLFGYTGSLAGTPNVDSSAFDDYRGASATIDTSTSGQINLVTTAASPGTLTWLGGDTLAPFAWDLVNSQNWDNSGSPDVFYQLDSVSFTNDGDNSSPVNITGLLTPAAVTVDATIDYTFAGTGSLGGTMPLVKKNTGTLVITNTNTSVGTVSVEGGTLQVGNGGSTGSLGAEGGGTVTVLAGANLAFNRSDDVTLGRTVAGAGTLVKNGGGTLVSNLAGTVLPTNLVVNSGTFQFANGGFGANRMEGDGLITINSGGIVLVSAAHGIGGDNGTMTEAVTINGGTLTLNSEQYLRTLTLNGGLINGSNEMRTTAGNTFLVTGTTPSTISAGINNFNAANWNVENVTGDAAADLIVAGYISNGGALVKNGAGTMLITGNPSFTGAFTLNEGVVAIQRPGAFTLANTLAGTATLRNDSPGALTLVGNSRNFAGTVDANGQDLVLEAGVSGGGSTATLAMKGGTLSFATPLQHGVLFRTSLAGAANFAGGTSTATSTADLQELHNNNPPVVPANTTYAYTGEIYLEGGHTYYFAEGFDDGVFLKIGSTTILNDPTGYNVNTAGSITPPATGWYAIDLRVGQGGGGVGPNGANGWVNGKGVGFHVGSAPINPTNGTEYTAITVANLAAEGIAVRALDSRLFRTAFGGSDFVTSPVPLFTTTDFQELHNNTGTVVPGNTTYAYTGEIYLSGGTAYYFAEAFDDAVYLNIGGIPVLNNTAWDQVSAGSFTAPATGWFAIDLRVFQGTGGVGPTNGTNGVNWAAGKGVGFRIGTAPLNPLDGAEYNAFTVANLSSSGVLLRAVESNRLVANVSLGGGAASTISTANAPLVIDGAISGGDELVKAGGFDLTLNAANSYTGKTTVAAGTLVLGSAGSIGSSALLQVDPAATLDVAAVTGGFQLSAGQTLTGAGDVTGAATILGTLNPGSVGGIGTLTTDALTFGDTAILAADLRSTTGDIALDRVNLGGNLSILAGAQLLLNEIGEDDFLAIGTKLVLLDYTGFTWDGGTFAGYANNSTFTLGANQWTIKYDDTSDGVNSGNFLTLLKPDTDPFTAWAAGFGLGPATKGDDSDGDGVLNLVEFALGGNPTDPASRGTQVVYRTDASNADELVLTILVRAGAPAFAGTPSPAAEVDKVRYTVRGSLTLNDGFNSAVVPVAVQSAGLPAAPAGYEYRSFRLVAASGLPARGFLQVLIEELP